MRPLLANPAVQLIIEEPADEIVAYTDEGKLSQILRNFVSNSIKFTEAGEIRVRAQQISGGEMLRISVIDSGIGIPHQFHDQIFEEFTQVENPLQRHARGTGLGLSLSKRLSELLGGTIGMSSEPQRGSTFVVQVPRIFRGAVPAAGERMAAAAAEPSPSIGQQGKPLVLLIDDDEASRYVARQDLAKQAITVAEASNGFEGIAMARNLRPQAIVLDLVMPDMDGFEVFKALHADVLTQNIPIILRTSKPIEMIDRERLRGAIDVITKNPETGSAQLQRAIRWAGVIHSAPTPELGCA
jgi:CheY-like chemotaxis protein